MQILDLSWVDTFGQNNLIICPVQVYKHVTQVVADTNILVSWARISPTLELKEVHLRQK